ncbi:ferritin-like domain-containing protein [Streptomyces sp. NPDC059142]|uniref:ferritin-like domain-containing protein n=1 Tax=Streptomyces sp. NPDC059142 TaxID=3346739 RepID=UPI00368392E2
MGAERVGTRPSAPHTGRLGDPYRGTSRGTGGVRAPVASEEDIMALQTAASLENLAAGTYRAFARLPFVANGNRTLAEFVTRTARHHEEHAKAFNEAVTRAGGREQSGTDPKYAAVVREALPTLRTPGDMVGLAISLEDVAAQTYTKNIGQVSSEPLRRLFGSVAPVEAQHRATLLVVRALLSAGDERLIARPADAGKLPAAVGSAGLPDAFQSTADASPVSEGAIR